MSDIGRVAQQGAEKIHVQETKLSQKTKPGDTEARLELDYLILLDGPATFIRIRSDADCRLFFWHDTERQRLEFFEGLEADVPLKIIDENWAKMIIVGPVGTKVQLYASRTPLSGLQGEAVLPP